MREDAVASQTSGAGLRRVGIAACASRSAAVACSKHSTLSAPCRIPWLWRECHRHPKPDFDEGGAAEGTHPSMKTRGCADSAKEARVTRQLGLWRRCGVSAWRAAHVRSAGRDTAVRPQTIDEAHYRDILQARRLVRAQHAHELRSVHPGQRGGHHHHVRRGKKSTPKCDVSVLCCSHREPRSLQLQREQGIQRAHGAKVAMSRSHWARSSRAVAKSPLDRASPARRPADSMNLATAAATAPRS
jgi:hypothetical protein